MRLIRKIFISGYLVAETGLHIGGSKSALDIGGVDLNIIKTPDGTPFIPGSSLKGKLRSLLARIEGSTSVRPERNGPAMEKTDENVHYIIQLFGSTGEDDQRVEVTRLLVRDAYLESGPNQDDYPDMDFQYSDVKWENTINRKTGVAQHPRQLERVPAGARFGFQLVYDVYDVDEEPYQPSESEEVALKEIHKGENRSAFQQHLWAIRTAMELLQDDYLGGQGSRGYGRVRFEEVLVRQKGFVEGQYAEVVIGEELEKLQNYFNQ